MALCPGEGFEKPQYLRILDSGYHVGPHFPKEAPQAADIAPRTRFVCAGNRAGYASASTGGGEVPVDGVHTSASRRSQFSPITLRILDPGHPRRSIAAVRFG